MTPSMRRLGRSPARRSRPVDPLTNLQDAYLYHHQALDHSPKTLAHYRVTFATFDHFLAATGRPNAGDVLTTACMQQFATWLRDTPTRLWRGGTTRSAVGVHGILKDMRAWTRWLAAEGQIE